MGQIKRIVKKYVKLLDDAYYYCVIRKAEYDKIKDRRNCWEKVSLTDDQAAAAEKVYGRNADLRWHRYFTYFTGKFDAQYIPDTVFALDMECKLNPRKIAVEMEDKARLPILYGDVPDMVLPKTVVLNTSGIYYDGAYNVVSKARAEELVWEFLQKQEEAVKKPTRGTGGGMGVVILNTENFNGFSDEKDFIVQERIINQEDIRALNPASLNTMRVITYICNDQYYHAPIAMRLGCGTSRLDNITSGGICVGVKDDGQLCSHAYTEYCVEKYPKHPYTGIFFDGYQIRNVDKVIQAAIECHKRTPHMRMGSWDFTLNDEGKATLVEVNLTGQSVCFPQYTHGRCLFGENTREMLKVLEKKYYL